MTPRHVEVVEVWAWGERVGAVAQAPSSARYVFAYTPEWIEGGVELSPLTTPLREAPYALDEWPDLTASHFHDLIPLLDNSLPDAFGNALVNAWMAEHGVPATSVTPLDRLAYAADRAMGALEFRPPVRDRVDDVPVAVQLADLVVAARRTVQGDLTSDDASRSVLDQLIQVGTSAGGARAKAVVAFNPNTDQIHSAYASPEAGFEQWLIKLDGVSDTGMDGHGGGLGDGAPYGRIEFAYYLMASAAGVTMSESRLLSEGPRHHFMTRRHDRGPGDQRHHVISLCALAHLDARLVGAHSYDQYLGCVRALGLGPDDLQQAYRRMVFNVLGVNRDDHTKNFAFLRRRDAGWELAPAFDVTHSYRESSQWTGRHNLLVNGATTDVTLDDLYAVGERHDVPAYRRVAREVSAAVDEWRFFALEAGLDDATMTNILHDIVRFRPR